MAAVASIFRTDRGLIHMVPSPTLGPAADRESLASWFRSFRLVAGSNSGCSVRSLHPNDTRDAVASCWSGSGPENDAAPAIKGRYRRRKFPAGVYHPG